MGGLDDLYQQLILDHYRNRRGRGRIDVVVVVVIVIGQRRGRTRGCHPC